MKISTLFAAGVFLAGQSILCLAQVPAILGTWKLNIAASRVAGPAPQLQVRSYRLGDDGMLTGVAVTIDDQGRPNFLQFVARVDGRDYAEFSTDSAANYLRDGTHPPRTYSEISTDDPQKVKWLDKLDGKLLFSGERWVSSDGRTMSFTLDMKDQQGKDVQYLYVFDRTGT